MSQAEDILAGLGGAGNVEDLEACITRLRVEVSDNSKVNEDKLKSVSFGVMVSGEAVQVIVGPEADTIAEDIRDLM